MAEEGIQIFEARKEELNYKLKKLEAAGVESITKLRKRLLKFAAKEEKKEIEGLINSKKYPLKIRLLEALVGLKE